MAALLPRIATLEAIFTTMPSSGKGRGNNSSKIAEKVSKRRFLFRCVYAPVPCFFAGPPKSNAVHVEVVPGSTWRIFFLPSVDPTATSPRERRSYPIGSGGRWTPPTTTSMPSLMHRGASCAVWSGRWTHTTHVPGRTGRGCRCHFMSFPKIGEWTAAKLPSSGSTDGDHRPLRH